MVGLLGLLGPEDIGIVILIAVVIFGGTKIPQLARSLGRAKGEFTQGLQEGGTTEQPKQPAEQPKQPAQAADPPESRASGS